jgi:hypothetical protein
MQAITRGRHVRQGCREGSGRQTTMFEGVVQSVEADVKRDPDKRWRVTLRDFLNSNSTPP